MTIIWVEQMKKLKVYAVMMTVVAVIFGCTLINLLVEDIEGKMVIRTIILQSVTVIISVVCSIISSLMWEKIIASEKSSIDMEMLVKKIENEIVKFAPTKVYAGTNIKHQDFNQKLNAAIEDSVHYYYMGDKAKFTAKRLNKDIKSTHDKLKIDILLPDLSDKTLFSSRIAQLRYFEFHYSGKKKSDDELIINEKKDILKSLYLLKKLENRYDISIYLHKELPLYRLELTDNILIITILTSLIDGNYYPLTFLYESEAQLIEAYKDYIEEVKLRSRFLKMNILSDDYLEALGKKYITSSFSKDEFIECDLVEGMER